MKKLSLFFTAVVLISQCVYAAKSPAYSRLDYIDAAVRAMATQVFEIRDLNQAPIESIKVLNNKKIEVGMLREVCIFTVKKVENNAGAGFAGPTKYEASYDPSECGVVREDLASATYQDVKKALAAFAAEGKVANEVHISEQGQIEVN